jgi:DNA-binding winged helix-turn-helix (wHTH) protein/TolB-like protein
MPTTLRFGRFEFHPASGELIADGSLVRLEPQPARVLAVLASRAGQVVTREDLRQEIWPADVFVDFERGLAYCIRRVRQALGDSAQAPRFVETLPKRGYRFLPPVESTEDPRRWSGGAGSSSVAGEPPGLAAQAPGGRQLRAARRRMPGRAKLAAIAVLASLLAAAAAALVHARSNGSVPILAVTLFDNETARQDLDQKAQVLTDVLVERLAEEPARWSVIGNAAILRLPRPMRNLTVIAGSLHADAIVAGQVLPGERGLTILTHLIRARDQRHLWVGRFEAPPGGVTPAVVDRICGRVAEEVARRTGELR